MRRRHSVSVLVALVSSIAVLVAPANARADAGHSADGTAAVDATGTWRGALGGRLRVVIRLAKGADGKLSGTLESIDQGATIAIESANVNGSTLHFTVARIGGVYEGRFDGKGMALDGTWTQNGVPPQPLALQRDTGKTSDAASKAPPATTTATSPPPQAPRPLDAPIDVLVPVAPTPFQGSDGKTHLVYEAHVTNFAPREISLRRFEVLAADGKSLARLEAGDLPAAIDRPGLPPVPGDTTRVGPGLRAVIRVWVTLAQGAAVPVAVDNRVTLRVGDDPTEWSVKQRLAVRTEPPIVIGPPLEGAGWVAANGPSNTSNHRRAILPVGGRAHVAQRFAIDWLRAEGEQTFHGDAKKNASYLCYGARALAVADGTVVAVKDGIPENVPGVASRAVPMTLETLGGNHVVLDLGGGHYALYGHFQPKSLRVKVGDRVKRGQLLGLVGNSGNSTEPHLHFHIADAPSPLGAEGLPYLFDWSKQLPLELATVEFPRAK